ncbi:ste ste20 ysk protein kinase [Moniliophthora roreri]|nr:ste ste20 ysk protein kinase [Moniliophthora roreri]
MLWPHQKHRSTALSATSPQTLILKHSNTGNGVEAIFIYEAGGILSLKEQPAAKTSRTLEFSVQSWCPRKIVKKHNILPPSSFMNNVTRQGGYPVRGGGFSKTGWALEEQIIIIQALQFLRNRKVAYRNIRAESMWLNYDRILKLGGFVDSIVMIETSVPSPTTGFRDYWQAPETAYPYLNPYNTFKADMWSLGAVTWALIQGEPPSRDSGPSTLRYSCPALDSGSCSTVLYKFVQRCLANPVGHPDIGRLAKVNCYV